MARRTTAGALGTMVLLVLCGCTATEETVPAEGAAAPPPVEARVSVDRAVATTGDVITYTVEIERDPQYRLALPEPGAEIAGFRVLDLGQESRRLPSGRVVEERWYELRADLVGSYVLPPTTVSYWPAGDEEAAPAEGEVETLSTSEIFVEVESVLAAAGDADDIRDLKPLRRVEEPLPWQLILAAGVIAFVAAVVAFVLWRRRRERPAVPPPPPHEVAFEALDRLRGTDFDDPEAVRRYYFAISEVVRAYVEGRFALNATDLTTEEILPRLGDLADLRQSHRHTLESFLAETDRVKFAAYRPQEEEIETTYEQALGFVEATRPIPETTNGHAESAEASATGMGG